MLRHCLFCTKAFPANELVEHLPLGERIAFDPLRGRLWVICGACRRWTLMPIEERWAALEELEQLSTDRARLLAQTEHIALLRAEQLQVIRVGRANLAEQAWWRYGRELMGRHARYNKLLLLSAGLVTAGVVGKVVAGGVGSILGTVGVINWVQVLPLLVREYRFRAGAWKGEASCSRCGAVLREITLKETGRLLVVAGVDGIEVRSRCQRCGVRSPEAGYRLVGAEGERLLRRALAYHNYQGASESRVAEATRLVENGGAYELLTPPRGSGSGPLPIANLGSLRQLALEIAVNEEVERELLEMELSALEARWREEEELAAIVDGELTPLPSPRQESATAATPLEG